MGLSQMIFPAGDYNISRQYRCIAIHTRLTVDELSGIANAQLLLLFIIINFKSDIY